MVVMGPAADDATVGGGFREFWGSMADVRRFRDGSINLCAVWECAANETHKITSRIADFLLRRHIIKSHSDDVAAETTYTHVVDSFDSHLLTIEADTSSSINGFFDRLCTHIRDLDHLPLPIDSIRPICALGSSTDIAPPLPNMHATSGPKSAAQKRQRTQSASSGSSASEVVCVKPFEAVIEFASSSKWPTTVEAIEQVKAAFYVELSQQLASVCGVQSTPWETHLDVYLAGFVFRFYIHYSPLLKLLKQQTPAVAKQLRALYVHRGQHVAFVALFSSKFAIFSKICHLAKIWIHSHLFSELVPEDVVELLVCALFCRYQPNPNDRYPDLPQSPLTGFLRFLRLLAFFNWQHDPLVVHPDHLTPSPASIQSTRQQMHKVDIQQRPTLYIVPSYHRSPVELPLLTMQMFKSLVSLARQALVTFDSRLASVSAVKSATAMSLGVLFVPSFTEFDLLIMLHPGAAPGKSISSANRAALFGVGRYQNLAIQEGKKNMLIGFDAPAHFLRLLKERFGHLALFFYNAYRADIITVVWKPEAFLPRSFKPATASLTIPIPAQSFVLPNILEIIAEIQLMGAKLVKKIVVH